MPTARRTNIKLLLIKKISTRWLTLMQTYSRLMASKMATNHILISSWWFWGKLIWKAGCRSSYWLHWKKYYRCLLERCHILCYKNWLEIWSYKKCWSLNEKLNPELPTWIPEPKTQQAPTRTTQMAKPNLWSNNKMWQGKIYTIHFTRTDTKTNPTNVGKIYSLWPGSQPSATGGTWIHHRR